MGRGVAGSVVASGLVLRMPQEGVRALHRMARVPRALFGVDVVSCHTLVRDLARSSLWALCGSLAARSTCVESLFCRSMLLSHSAGDEMTKWNNALHALGRQRWSSRSEGSLCTICLSPIA